MNAVLVGGGASGGGGRGRCCRVSAIRGVWVCLEVVVQVLMLVLMMVMVVVMVGACRNCSRAIRGDNGGRKTGCNGGARNVMNVVLVGGGRGGHCCACHVIQRRHRLLLLARAAICIRTGAGSAAGCRDWTGIMVARCVCCRGARANAEQRRVRMLMMSCSLEDHWKIIEEESLD